jgi:hypothetical protein
MSGLRPGGAEGLRREGWPGLRVEPRQTHLGLMLCMSALFAATLSTSPANRGFGYTDRRAGADQNHLPSSNRAIRTTSHAAGASSATCTSPSQERQLTCSCVAAGISTLRAGVPRLRGKRVSAPRGDHDRLGRKGAACAPWGDAGASAAQCRCLTTSESRKPACSRRIPVLDASRRRKPCPEPCPELRTSDRISEHLSPPKTSL